MTARIEHLKQMRLSRPDDPFPFYALGIECKNEGLLDQAKLYLEETSEKFPDYVPTYYHLGQVLEELDDEQQAIEVYKTGLIKASAAGDSHAAAELGAALQFIGGSE